MRASMLSRREPRQIEKREGAGPFSAHARVSGHPGAATQVSWVPAFAGTSGARFSSSAQLSLHDSERDNTQDSLAPVRPIRLFVQPELITEVVAEVPDGPPARFCWRRIQHHVAAAEGPERIAMEWWRDDKGRALTRDYFRVECSEGLRVWIYREGTFTDVRAVNWFLHGLFA
jgi:hypothetical protein